MIAVSSAKPFEKSLEVAENQLRAKESWEKVFSRIFYLGEPEQQLASNKTTFQIEDQFPPISLLCVVAAENPGWSCLINADIVLSPRFAVVEHVLDAMKAKGAVSKRFQIRPDVPAKQWSVEDWGLDIFIAKQEIWQRAAKEIPETFRIGHVLWDTWMVAFLMSATNGACVDLTPARLVFHPQHTVRERPFSIECPPEDQYIRRVRWPAMVIKI